MFASRRQGRRPASAATTHGIAPEILSSVEHLKTNWFWSSDAAGKLTYVSDWLPEDFGTTMDALVGRALTGIFRREGLQEHSTFGLLLAKQRPFHRVAVRSSHDRKERVWTLSGNPQFDERGEFQGFAGIAADVTAVQESAAEISRLASYDPLTSLRNRRGMASLVGQALLALERHGKPFAILLVDLDRFKQINDTLGHPAGDQLLEQVAERLTSVVGATDCVGRIGGDEFQIVLGDGGDPEETAKLADAIIASLSQPYMIDTSRCVIGASVGIVVCPTDGTTPDDLFRNVDLALYAAKAAGRGRARFFSQDMHDAAEDRRSLEDDLIDALERGELEVNYQPLVDAKTNLVSGFEALLRWNHPQRGRISPALFIPIAEEANLIARLGEWVMRQACQDAAAWNGNLRVAVNVSPIQFADPALPQTVLSALAHSGLAPGRLELEITESVFLNDGKETDATFAALKKIGVRLALDDFGTGYSSLGYLKTAPFDKIKIDQSFVRGAPDPRSRNNAIITSIVALARALDMETTAEGIETLDQLETMRALGVSHIQGYLYSLPVADAVVAEKVKTGQWEIQPIGPAKQRQARVATFRRLGVVHGDHCYPVILRNLSSSGALIEGLVDVPIGTRLVVDFGDRQWAVATVRRSRGDHQGVEFDEPLVSDGEGSYCTRYRVSALMMSQVGLTPRRSHESGWDYQPGQDLHLELPTFKTSLK